MAPTNRLTAQPWSPPGPTRVVSTSEKRTVDGQVTSPLFDLYDDILITNCYEMTSARMPFAATPRVTANWTLIWPSQRSHIQELCSYSICLKWTKSDHQHQSSQGALPFATTSCACIPTLFIANVFSIFVHMYCNHWPSFRSTVNINRLEVYIKIIYLVWRYISHLLTSKHEI